VCVCDCLSSHAHTTHYCTDPDVTSGNGGVSPRVVHYWADLQSVLRFRCHDNIAPRVLAVGAHDVVAANAKCQRVTRCAPG